MLDGDKKADCKHCEGGESQSYWNISLDLDLLQTIVNFYPEWFKNCNMGDLKLQNGDPSLSAFHEQRQKLVKARIGSILKHKLPKKLGTLIQPALKGGGSERSSEKSEVSQNSSFELVKENNILVEAVQAFKSPCSSPKMTLGLDDDSDGIFSPTPPYEFNEHSQGSLPSLEASEPSPNLNQGSPYSEITSFSMSPPSSVSSPSLVSPQPVHDQIVEYMVHMQQQQQPPNPAATNKNKKKTKPKTQPKARTIKFHEYKGPPNSKNTCSSSNSLPESPPQLNFQQQQLILELQSAFHKHDFRSQTDDDLQKISGDQSGQRNEKPISSNQNSHPITLISNFEDLKVSDLRAELKRRNLPVSGSKPQLIERLKTHPSSLPDTSLPSDAADTMKELLNSLPFEDPCGDSLEVGDVSPLSKEEIIVQLQQIYIERLQMDLERSQRQLLECQQPMTLAPVADAKSPIENTPTTSSTSCSRGSEASFNSETKTSQKQLIQQLLQQKIQKQEQQKNHRLKANTSSTSPLTALLKSSPLNALAPPGIKRENVSYTEEDDFPGVIPILVNESPTDANPSAVSPTNRSSSLPSFSALCKTPATQNPQFQISKPPPDYNAATKHLQKAKQPPSPSDGNTPKKHKTCVKSQAVDDVLAVLIASGDLPPSAAEEPNTFQSPDFFSSTNMSLAQSLMDITPPSSAGLGALDFGPLLDLDEMDFGLEDGPNLDPTLSQELKGNLDYKSLVHSKPEKDIQQDIMDWLPVQNDSAVHSPPNNFQGSSSSYSLTSENETLFPNTQDALDFLEDEMDFNTPNDLFFPWGEKPDLT